MSKTKGVLETKGVPEAHASKACQKWGKNRKCGTDVRKEVWNGCKKGSMERIRERMIGLSARNNDRDGARKEYYE